MSSVRILAPAKINLGLAVLGKRPDGYHNIDTIMVMIELADVLTIHRTMESGVTIAGMDDVPVELNAIAWAIRGYSERAGITGGFHVEIDKRIPSSAGLGGGSSDAAATLRALDVLFGGTLGADDLHRLAVAIGADSPFFLRTVAARGTGTGTDLRPVPPYSGWVVIVVPPSELEAKTARLYASLEPRDYGVSADIDRIECDLRHNNPPVLKNSFTRAARTLLPGVNRSWDVMLEVVGTCALSGAGPAVYALAEDEARAHAWRDELRWQLPGTYTVIATRSLTRMPMPELLA